MLEVEILFFVLRFYWFSNNYNFKKILSLFTFSFKNITLLNISAHTRASCRFVIQVVYKFDESSYRSTSVSTHVHNNNNFIYIILQIPGHIIFYSESSVL